ncbi:hypothetical protein SY89_01038 [Halolamina pelagica]|uniref:Uncharacterized protein n=1 Tax=Halolamina pelagica TaxID=699431 RepID=A0A0P7GNR6_9EURY|nr:hypothetical protein SY89_01038 [Halolamina pelagica]
MGDDETRVLLVRGEGYVAFTGSKAELGALVAEQLSDVLAPAE